MTYFILGSNPELSFAELRAVLKSSFQPIYVSKSVVVTQMIEQECGMLQNRLAGVIKIGRIVGELGKWDKTEIVELIASLAVGAKQKNKISFGVSVYDLEDEKQTITIQRELDDVGLAVKKILKTTGRPVRYVKGKEPRLSSAIIETNGLLLSGGEFVILVSKDKILIGQTQTIQDFRAWEKRDFGRPSRDAKSGMLPPKLARMMINLSGADPTSAMLLDPFCGSGTILTEAVEMGFTKLVGSDISQKAIDDTRNNLQWLSHAQNLDLPPISLYTISAEQLATVFKERVDALVTEVFLGSPRVKPAMPRELKTLEQNLLPLYEKSFGALKPILKPDARCIIAFPAFKKTDNSWHRLPLQNLLNKLGFDFESQYLYHRENQLVARDIVVIKRGKIFLPPLIAQ